MKFSVKDFFIFTEEILSGNLFFVLVRFSIVNLERNTKGSSPNFASNRILTNFNPFKTEAVII